MESKFLADVRELLAIRLFEVHGEDVTLGTAATVVLVLVGTFVFSRLLRRGVRRAFEMRGVKDEARIGLVGNVIHYVLLFVGLHIALSTLGLDLSALFAAGAVFAVGIGFAMQNIAQNFVSGVILMAERSIKAGDVVEVDGQVLRVVSMGIRSTVAQSRNGEDFLVPNSVLVQNTVRNRTLNSASYRASTSVGVSYSSDMKLVQSTLEAVAAALHDEASGFTSQVLLTGFGSSSVDFEVAVWTLDPWRERLLRSNLNHAIWDALAEHEISIAFPQVDVHFDAPNELLRKAV